MEKMRLPGDPEMERGGLLVPDFAVPLIDGYLTHPNPLRHFARQSPEEIEAARRYRRSLRGRYAMLRYRLSEYRGRIDLAREALRGDHYCDGDY